MNLLDILPVTEIPALDKILSLGILLTFAYFFWNKISAIENKRDSDNATNQKKYEDLVNNILVNMEKRFSQLSIVTNDIVIENSKAIEANTTIIKNLIKS